MTPRHLAVVGSYEDLVAALRVRIDELQWSRETVDAVVGLTPGLAGKLFGPSQVKRMGWDNLWRVLEALGLHIHIVEHLDIASTIDEADSRHKARHDKHRRVGVVRKRISPELQRMIMREMGRKGGGMASARHGTEHMSAIAAMGGAGRWRKLTKRQRRELARKIGKLGAAKRWSKPTAATRRAKC